MRRRGMLGQRGECAGDLSRVRCHRAGRIEEFGGHEACRRGPWPAVKTSDRGGQHVTRHRIERDRRDLGQALSGHRADEVHGGVEVLARDRPTARARHDGGGKSRKVLPCSIWEVVGDEEAMLL